MITAEFQAETTTPPPRRTSVLRLVGVAPSSWHRPVREGDRKRPGPAPRRIADEVVQPRAANHSNAPGTEPHRIVSTHRIYLGYRDPSPATRRAPFTVSPVAVYAPILGPPGPTSVTNSSSPRATIGMTPRAGTGADAARKSAIACCDGTLKLRICSPCCGCGTETTAVEERDQTLRHGPKMAANKSPPARYDESRISERES